MAQFKVIVIDNHRIVRAGLAYLIKSLLNVEIVGQAESLSEFPLLVSMYKPDLVFVKFRMLQNYLINSGCYFKKMNKCKIIALMNNEEDVVYIDLFKGKVKGMISKNADTEEIRNAINTIMNGGLYYSSDIVHLLNRNLEVTSAEIDHQLSRREIEILQLIGKGSSTNEIADELSLSPRTVESHKASLLEKTKMKNTINLVLFAVKNRLISI